MNDNRSSPSNEAKAARASSATSGPLIEGSLFAGRYRIVRSIAAGGMGAVYEVIHVETERRRALKVMHPHLFQSEEMRERFRREARIAAHVQSEYIVDVSDAGVDEATKTPFLVMELLDGEDLGDRLERIGHLPPRDVMTYLQQVALALDKTHAKSIVHRDLKPENLFLTLREDGSPRIKILDFGVAKLVADGATGARATRSLGTPLYMAPEQFRTGSKLMPAADIHALGMMAFTLLSGDAYWSPEARAAGDVIAFALTVVRGPQESAVKRAAARGVMLPPEFDRWFARVTALNPADRYPKASDAVRALGEVLGIAAAPVGACAATTPAPTAAHVVNVGMLERASTSAGTAMKTIPPERPRSRAALITVAGGVGLIALVASGWLVVRQVSSAPPANPASTSFVAVAATPPETIVEPAAPVQTEMPSTPGGAAPETTAEPTVRPAAAGTAPTAKPKPIPIPTARPAATPERKPTARPLLGQD